MCGLCGLGLVMEFPLAKGAPAKQQALEKRRRMYKNMSWRYSYIQIYMVGYIASILSILYVLSIYLSSICLLPVYASTCLPLSSDYYL